MHSSQKGQPCLSPLPPATHSWPFPCAGTSIRMVSQWAESRNQSGWKLTQKTTPVIHFYSGATNETLKEFDICTAMGELVHEINIPSWVSLLYSKKVVLTSLQKRLSMSLAKRVNDPSQRKIQENSLVGCIYMQITASISFLCFYFFFYYFKLCWYIKC